MFVAFALVVWFHWGQCFTSRPLEGAYGFAIIICYVPAEIPQNKSSSETININRACFVFLYTLQVSKTEYNDQNKNDISVKHLWVVRG